MTRKTLTKEDVSKLLTDPSGANRAQTAAKIAADFGQATRTESERAMAEEIFRIMVKDAEVRVREALAQALEGNPALPRDVAMSLAKDVDSVALPVSQVSEVPSDEDLIEIVRRLGPVKPVAVAGRSTVSEAVSSALVETGNEDVVTTLVANTGAEISEKSLHKVVEDFGDTEAVQDAMVHRPQRRASVKGGRAPSRWRNRRGTRSMTARRWRSPRRRRLPRRPPRARPPPRLRECRRASVESVRRRPAAP